MGEGDGQGDTTKPRPLGIVKDEEYKQQKNKLKINPNFVKTLC